MQRINEPFFIVGASRSGTTLLRLMLAGHSRIHIPSETWFMLPLVERLPLSDTLSPSKVEEAVSTVVQHPRWADMGMDGAEFRSGVADLAKPTLAGIVSLVYRHQLQQMGKVRIGDKTPLYIGIVPQLAKVFPDARFIHLIRDGRDVAISFVDADFEERWYEGERFEWLAAAHRHMDYLASPLASRILTLHYEDLVRAPESGVRKVCDFLGEQFEPSMLKTSDRTHMIPERGHRIHAKLGKPISQESADGWKRKLTPVECFAMEACMHSELQRLGYGLRFQSPVWKPVLTLTGALLRASSPMLVRAIPALQRRGLLSKPLYF